MASEHWNKYQSEYQKTHYKSLGAQLDAELVKKFKAQLKKDNLSVARFLRNAIELYLKSSI